MNHPLVLMLLFTVATVALTTLGVMGHPVSAAVTLGVAFVLVSVRLGRSATRTRE